MSKSSQLQPTFCLVFFWPVVFSSAAFYVAEPSKALRDVGTSLSGELSDNHDVISVKVFELESPEGSDLEDRSGIEPASSYFESPRDHVEDPKPSAMSGVKTFFLLLLGVLGCIACVVIGIMIYQKQQDNSRKRFY